MALDLRPLTLAELLDRSFSTYKRHLWLFVGIMAVPASLAVVYSAIMQVLQFALGIQQQPDPDAKPTDAVRLDGGVESATRGRFTAGRGLGHGAASISETSAGIANHW